MLWLTSNPVTFPLREVDAMLVTTFHKGGEWPIVKGAHES
jgi:hypothetical protein